MMIFPKCREMLLRYKFLDDNHREINGVPQNFKKQNGISSSSIVVKEITARDIQSKFKSYTVAKEVLVATK